MGDIPAQGQLFAAFYQQQGQRQNRQQVASLQAEERLVVDGGPVQRGSQHSQHNAETDACRARFAAAAQQGRFVLPGQGGGQHRQQQAYAQQPTDIDAVDDGLPQGSAQQTLQPESALLRQGAQQQLDGGRNVATDIAKREGPDGVPVGVGHGQLVRVQPAAHVGDSVKAAHSAHHQYGGKSQKKNNTKKIYEKENTNVLVALKLISFVFPYLYDMY